MVQSSQCWKICSAMSMDYDLPRLNAEKAALIHELFGKRVLASQDLTEDLARRLDTYSPGKPTE